jgi:hypothetical protein
MWLCMASLCAYRTSGVASLRPSSWHCASRPFSQPALMKQSKTAGSKITIPFHVQDDTAAQWAVSAPVPCNAHHLYQCHVVGIQSYVYGRSTCPCSGPGPPQGINITHHRSAIILHRSPYRYMTMAEACVQQCGCTAPSVYLPFFVQKDQTWLRVIRGL